MSAADCIQRHIDRAPEMGGQNIATIHPDRLRLIPPRWLVA